MFRYVCTDENGCEHIVGYAFAGEYVGDYPQCIKKEKAIVSIQATTDSLIYYASAQEITNFFSTDKSTQELEKILAEELCVLLIASACLFGRNVKIILATLNGKSH